MASGSALIDRVCATAKMDATASSADRTLVLGYLNDIYHRAVEETGCYAGTFSKTLTSGTADYTLGTAPLDVTDILRIKQMWLTDGSVTNRPVKQVTEQDIRDLRSGSSVTGSTYCYAVSNPLLFLYPTPGASTTLAGSYVKEPTALADGSTAPTAFPARFHHDVLSNGATAIAMDYKQQPTAVKYWEQYEQALVRLHSWVNSLGGDDPSSFVESDWPRFGSRRAGFYP